MNKDVLYLLDHLNSYGHESLKDLGVVISTDPKYPDLFNLKYSIFSPKDSILTQVCRGIVVSKSDNSLTYSIEAYAFPRFFNLGEPWAANIDWENGDVKVYEKLDGSLIKLFWSNKYDRWLVSTSGSVDGSGRVGENNLTFKDLFIRTFNHLKYDASKLDKQVCYIFELCTTTNRVVVRYDEPQIVLLTARDANTWEEIDISQFSKQFQLPNTYQLNSIEEAREYAEKNGGASLEGFVIVDKFYNRLKIKSSKYVNLHNMKGEYTGSNASLFYDLLIADQLDEFITYFPEYSKIFSQFNQKMMQIEQKCEEIYDSLTSDPSIVSQKDFAIRVNSLCLSNGALKPYFFMKKAGKIQSFKEFFFSLNKKSAQGLIEFKLD